MRNLLSVRLEREAHALVSVSAGGFGAVAAIALKHPRDLFAVVATISRTSQYAFHDNYNGRCAEDFDPATYRERTEYLIPT